MTQASNKLNFFEHLVDTKLTPEYTTNPVIAAEWAIKIPVMARTILNGHSGAGIHIIKSPDNMIYAPLYTKYIKKASEWRIHMVTDYKDGVGHMFDVQRKVRRVGYEEPNWMVRNYANGFFYQRHNIDILPAVEHAACQVFNKFALQFGAIDIIYNEHEDRAYALEINTAAGLEGETLVNYTTIIQGLLK